MKTKTATETTDPIPYETLNDLAKASRAPMVELLNQRLADAIDLQSQVKQAHWNVKGPHFIALHELFDDIYGAVDRIRGPHCRTRRAIGRHRRRNGARGRGPLAPGRVSFEYFPPGNRT